MGICPIAQVSSEVQQNMYGTSWKGQKSFVNMQDTTSTKQSQMSEWSVLRGPWDQKTQERDPQTPKAVHQNRETPVRRELWRRHHFLILTGQVISGWGRTKWIPGCFSLSQYSLRKWEGVCVGKGGTQTSEAEEDWTQWAWRDQFYLLVI